MTIALPTDLEQPANVTDTLRLLMASHNGVTTRALERFADIQANLDGDSESEDGVNDQAELQEVSNEVLIYGEIISDSAADMYSWLGLENYCNPSKVKKVLAQNDGDITMRINSPGGSITATAAICSMINEYRTANPEAKISVIVEGLAASGASIIMMQSDHVAVNEFADVMIHNAWTCLCGNASELTRVATMLADRDKVMAQAYADQTGKTVAAMQKYMDAETFFTAQQAVDVGLADTVLKGKSDKKKKDKKMQAAVDSETAIQVLADAESASMEIFDLVMQAE